MKFFDKVINFRRQIWWTILLFVGIAYVLKFYENILNNPSNIDKTVALSLLVLLFMPLISELNFFGMSLKKEIEETKGELKSEIQNMKIDLMQFNLNNSMKNDITIGIGSNTLPSKESMKNDLGKKEIEALESDFDVSNDNVLLFKIRYSIEQLLNNLISKYQISEGGGIYQKAKILQKMKVIRANTSELIQKTILICNRSIHGEIVDSTYLNYAKEIYPTIQKALDEALEKQIVMTQCICPKCKYIGPSEYENICPICGFVSDEY
ncbi:hypothetical protein [Clostridium estertheticum]|uniref:hypothetical protein n=1 Tax=Clostridium estertheticum TaxID=238834 RepID=UPI001CF15D38|nr:hypothetical protein [Clostridium estertheticum]MCB2343304.1 hypothetical protein [Clostridium estertheticum]